MNKTISILILIILPFVTFCQSDISGKKVLMNPEKYKVPVENISISKTASIVEGEMWVVYSDRKNNFTTKKPGGSSTYKNINFMEKFYVLEDLGKYIHIIKDPEISYDGICSNFVKDYGYIEKDKMLLWIHCLVTEEAKIDKKAMILNTIDAIKKRQAKKIKKEDNFVSFYKDPNLIIKSNKKSRLYEIFFIYKLEKNSVLLGRINRISTGTDVTKIIVGWMPKTRINFWDHRIALEPNWDEFAVKDRKFNKIKASVLSDVTFAKKFGRDGNAKDRAIYWDADPYEKRNIGDWRRFPILDINDEENYYHIGLMGKICSDEGTLTQIEKANVDRQNSIKRQERRKINIVFVIDGSSSMGEYFKPVSKAINRSINNLINSQITTFNNIRFGAVVYRDFANGEKKIEIKPITKRYRDVASWLNNIVAGDWGDTDKPEAVYYGIKKALLSVGMSENETNVIVLVGDAGSHHREDETQVNKNELINLLSAYKCNFLAFQVHNDENYKTYDEFKIQMKELIFKTAQKLYQNNKIKELELKEPSFISTANNRDTLNKSAIMGMLVYPNKGEKLSTSNLENEIYNIVNYTNANIEDFIEITDRLIYKGEGLNEIFKEGTTTKNTNKEVSSFAPAILSYLSDMKIPYEQLNILVEEKYQFYTEAYTPIKVKSLNYPLFTRVLFLNRVELGELISIMNKLSVAKTAIDRRKCLQDTWIEILKSHIGNMNEEELMNLDLEKINKKVFGLPGTSKLLKDVKLKYLTDNSVVKNIDIAKYINKIDSKVSKLNKILNYNNYTYSFMSNDENYYWIPEQDLP